MYNISITNNARKTLYINEAGVNKIELISASLEEGWLDAYRMQLKNEAKKIYAKEAAVYYVFKNGKLFLFFDKNSLGIGDYFYNKIHKFLNKLARIVFNVQLTDEEKKEFKIKKGADIHDVKHVLEYYQVKKDLTTVSYNKMCNTWSYLVLPFIKGSKAEKEYRLLIKKLNGVAIPERVLKNPEVLNEIIPCKK